ncbi:MAG: hypothetical protein WD603_02350 [Patescibacteria group bacterium]
MTAVRETKAGWAGVVFYVFATFIVGLAGAVLMPLTGTDSASVPIAGLSMLVLFTIVALGVLHDYCDPSDSLIRVLLPTMLGLVVICAAGMNLGAWITVEIGTTNWEHWW